MTPADERAQLAILSRMGMPSGQSPMLVGFISGRVRFGIKFSEEKLALAFVAGVTLGKSLGVEILVFVYEAVHNVTPFTNPLVDPLGFTAVTALAWSDTEKVGWLSRLHRTDDGEEWWDEIEPLPVVPSSFDAAVQSAKESEPLDREELLGWLETFGHAALVYE